MAPERPRLVDRERAGRATQGLGHIALITIDARHPEEHERNLRVRRTDRRFVGRERFLVQLERTGAIARFLAQDAEAAVALRELGMIGRQGSLTDLERMLGVADGFLVRAQ